MCAVFILGVVGGVDTWGKRLRMADFNVLLHQVGVRHVDSDVFGWAPASTKAEHCAVAGRNPWRTVFVVGRRLVDR